MLKKWFYNFHRNCHNTLCSLTFCSLRFVTFNILRRKGLNCFPLEEWFFFQKDLFSTTFWVLGKWSYNLHQIRQKTLSSPTEKYSSSAVLGSMSKRKMGQKIFSSEWWPLFWKKFGSQFLGSRKNGHIACTILVKILSLHLQVFSWRSSYSITRENSAKILFSLENFVIFSKVCVFNSFLGPKEKIL